MRCKACRRPLTSETSKKFGYGPDCLKKAVEQGTAPLESLEEMRREQKLPRIKQAAEPIQERCQYTVDMFDADPVKEMALSLLRVAIRECESVGIKITYEVDQ